MSLAENNFGFTNAAVVGMLRCGAVNIGAGGHTFSGTMASNGKSASGTWDAGTWSGTFRAPPAIVVTPARDLVDAQAVQVRGKNFAPGAQMAVYECPASASLSSDCDLERPPSRVTASTAGSFAIARPVYETLVTTNGVVHCTKTPCLLRAENSQFLSELAIASVSLAKANIACTSRQSCQAAITVAASTAAPGQTITVSGRPTAPTGSILLDDSNGVLTCPGQPTRIAPIADLIDTGFAPTARLTVTETLHLASATSPEQVCFNSSIPFKSQSSPAIAKAGTALLLDCSAAGNKPPCIKSRAQIGTDMTVTFAVPGGDPRFYILCPNGRQIWALGPGTAHVGKQYSVHLQTVGGKAPIHWGIASGKLPDGCNLDPNNGTITGTPTKKGRYTPVVKATDSEHPPKSAQLPFPITVA